MGSDFNARLGAPTYGEENEIIGRRGYAEKDISSKTKKVQESR